MKTVFAIHTGNFTVNAMRQHFPDLLPGVRLVNLVDDGLLNDVRAAGHLVPAVTRRVVGYGILAASTGADLILNCCSSIGEAADVLAQAVDVPVVRIDSNMAEQAVATGSRIAIVATLATTLNPTERLVQKKAAQAGRPVATRRYLAGTAFDALVAGDNARHDATLKAEIERAMEENDVVVLAQGSMARLVSSLQQKVPVLSSPRSGVEAVKAQFAQ